MSIGKIPDLWPEDVGGAEEISPVTILKQQASSLYEKMQFKVRGEVVSTASGNELRHSFMLVVPSMDDYRFRLLSVRHEIQRMYPLDLYSDVHNRNYPIKTEAEFHGVLKDIFASDETKRVLQTLKASSET